MEYCSKCGTQFEGRFCPKCGNPSQQVILSTPKEKKLLSEKNWFCILMVFVFFPVGFYLLWRNGKISIAVKIILTVVEVGILALMIIAGSSDDKSHGDECLDIVKDGCPNIYLDYDVTYKEAFKDVFKNPKWRYFVSEDDEDIVEFTGIFDDDGEEYSILAQFKVDYDEDTFELTYMEEDNEPIDEDEINYIIGEIFDEEINQ